MEATLDVRVRPRAIRVRRSSVARWLDFWWPAAILFFNGWIFTLPVSESPLPFFVQPIQVVHGVFLHEFLLIGYLAFYFLVHGGRFPTATRAAYPYAALIVMLGALGIVSAIVNLRPAKELFTPWRYMLLAAYFITAVHWTQKYGRTFVLRYLLLGVSAAGSVNLFYTFKVRFQELGGFPLLLGEQGPGGYFGLSVVLSAWLMLEQRTRRDAIIAVFAGALSAFAVSISFSKLGMLMAASGIAAWAVILGRDLKRPRMRKWYAVAILAFAIVAGVKWTAVVRYAQAAKTFVEYKFRYVDKESVSARSAYFRITAEIVANHPFFGVSYGGFYAASRETNTVRRGDGPEEDPGVAARGESNPHSSLLYYASANGVPGLLLVLTILAASMFFVYRAVAGRRLAGLALWASFAFTYFIFSMTLPTLLNTAALYLPTAVAVSAAATRRLSIR